MISNDYILIQLFVDDKTPLPEPIEVIENNQPRKLRTSPRSHTENIDAYISFLKEGQRKY